MDVIIKNSTEQGISNKDLFTSLYKKGYEIEGVDTNQAKSELGLSQPIQQTGISGTISDIPSDIKQTAQGIGQAVRTRADNIADLGLKRDLGERTAVGTTLKQAGQLAGSAGDVIGELYKGAVKLALSPKGEEKAKEVIQNLGEKAMEIPAVQNTLTWYDKLPDAQKEAIDATGGVLSLATELIGAGASKKVVGGVVDATAPVVKKAGTELAENSTKILNELKSNMIETPTLSPDGKVSLVDAMKSNDFGITKETAGIKKIGDQTQFLSKAEKKKLLEINSEKGREYVDTLLKSEDNWDLPTVTDKAVQDVEKIVEKFNTVVSEKGNQIGEIKKKLSTLKVDTSDIDEVKNTIVSSLNEKGLQFKNGKFSIKKGVNSPFSNADVKTLNQDVVETLSNISKSKSMENLLLGMERLDNKINFSKSDSISGSLQGVSKNIRSKLKGLRDKALTPEEQGIFNSFSEAKTFADDFSKGNADNKIMTLLNTIGTKRDVKIKRVAETIKKFTGEDITEPAYLSKILIDATGGTSHQRSKLNQYIGEVASLSPTGLVGKITEGVAGKLINVDKLKEIEKALYANLK